MAAAIADVTGYPLVTCVLNTIDDALDRSDPGGTEWGADTVKHLAPLLDRARNAGRIVVLTADHGHVVERRQGTQRPYPDISSGRSRAATEPAGDGEVLVTGPRVLLHDGRAVLAVDEHLRYGPLKAGYHGGGAPAEAVVPVAVLVPGAVPEDVEPAPGAAAGAGLVDRPRRARGHAVAAAPPPAAARRGAPPPTPASAGQDGRRRPCSTSRTAEPAPDLDRRPSPAPARSPAAVLEVRRLRGAEEDRRAGVGHRRPGPRRCSTRCWRPGPPAGARRRPRRRSRSRRSCCAGPSCTSSGC